jgi:hypothetical protein
LSSSSGQKIVDFNFADNDTFVTLGRKLVRWSTDNLSALKDAAPLMPSGFVNRLAANWRLLLAIADLAGGAVPKQARAAAVKLSRKRHQPSEGFRLLEALRPIEWTRVHCLGESGSTTDRRPDR